MPFYIQTNQRSSGQGPTLKVRSHTAEPKSTRQQDQLRKGLLVEEKLENCLLLEARDISSSAAYKPKIKKSTSACIVISLFRILHIASTQLHLYHNILIFLNSNHVISSKQKCNTYHSDDSAGAQKNIPPIREPSYPIASTRILSSALAANAALIFQPKKINCKLQGFEENRNLEGIRGFGTHVHCGVQRGEKEALRVTRSPPLLVLTLPLSFQGFL